MTVALDGGMSTALQGPESSGSPAATRPPLLVEPEQRPATEPPRQRLRVLLDRDGERLRHAILSRGAILLRRTGITAPSDLEWFLRELTRSRSRNYSGGVSPRSRVEGRVYTSTELPAHLPIGLHNELSYSDRFPRNLAFLCESPATSGGETALADGRSVLAQLDPEIVERFERSGVRYEFAYPDRSRALTAANRIAGGRVGKTWMDVFETNDRDLAEARCRALGFDVVPGRHHELRARITLPAIVTHPLTRERAWFNQAHLFQLTPRALGWRPYLEAKLAFLHPVFRMHAVTYGDGAPIPSKMLDRVCRVLNQERTLVRMEPTDLLVLDNLLCMHGRARFCGPRRILVVMTEL